MAKATHRMSLAQAEAHQRRHGFASVAGGAEKKATPLKPKKPRMNKTETEFSLILEAQRQRGEINEWRFGSIKLAWGEDPETGKPMFYTPDFDVWKEADSEPYFIEVKGGYIRPQDWIRFKGCRACWPRFRFELHQRREGQWHRLY